jgi:glycosyltransferase involved in cell wall biosynthesis
MNYHTVTALPVYNEAANVTGALEGALTYSNEVLVVNDGSTDGTSELLKARDDIHLITHHRNLGYGAALRSAFVFAIRGGYDALVTIDCDGQHQPQLIPRFVETSRTADIVSGSRFLRRFPGDSDPPLERKRINMLLTEEINRRLGFNITDAFCGFKAYRTSALAKIALTENGYALPLELWVQAYSMKLNIVEVAIPLIYLDEKRSFGGALDQADLRLEVYRRVLENSSSAIQGTASPSTLQQDSNSWLDKIGCTVTYSQRLAAKAQLPVETFVENQRGRSFPSSSQR